MTVDVLIEDDRWAKAGLEPQAETAVRATLSHLGLDPSVFEIVVLGCDDARIAVLNGDFRAKAQATNVLSWPSEDLSGDSPGDAPQPPTDEELGNIAIAYETCAREAVDQGKPFDAHILHLLVHGVLHLLGYDHIDAQDAALMEKLEVEILATLGVKDPY